MPWRENKGVANLDGFKRIFFGGSLRLEILEEILIIKNGRGPEIIQ